MHGAWWMVHGAIGACLTACALCTALHSVQCAPPPFCSNRFRSWLLAVALVMFALASPPASFPRSADEQGNLNLASKCEGLPTPMITAKHCIIFMPVTLMLSNVRCVRNLWEWHYKTTVIWHLRSEWFLSSNYELYQVRRGRLLTQEDAIRLICQNSRLLWCFPYIGVWPPFVDLVTQFFLD